MTSLRYRKEIDGLRCIAVMAVVLAHAHVPFFQGGFVGVDIFFVISGFLITSILLRETQEGSFSIRSFYTKRARRILPALFFMILLCIPFAWVLMLPDPLENFAQSAFASVFSANNILLTLTSGYWDLASEFKPLLHTWSLGVEEQFYILYPALFMIPFLFRRLVWVIAAISIISFGLCVILYERAPNATFYLLHTRAWELGVGALGAIWMAKAPTPNSHNAVGLLGLLCIFVAIFFYTPETPYPSAYTLVPCLGALLVLMNHGDRNITVRLLSLKIMTGVGLISYSLYLYHQPVFAFARIASFESPTLTTYVTLIVVCIGLAFLSWKYIEEPFRRNTFSWRAPAATGALTAFTISALSLGIYFNDGFPKRVFGPGWSDSENAMTVAYNERIRGYITADFSQETQRPKTLVIGDSQARDFSNILIEMGKAGPDTLIYRSDINVCDPQILTPDDQIKLAQADQVFVAYNEIPASCLAYFTSGCPLDPRYVLIGPKHFGYNLNAFLSLPDWMRPQATAKVFPDVVALNAHLSQRIPIGHFINMLNAASEDGKHIRVFNDAGLLISADRIHVTQAGAKFFATALREHPLLKFKTNP